MFKKRILKVTGGVVAGALLSCPVMAGDTDELSWTETKDKWGQLLFCQRIYKLPEVQTRLYSFDYERCDKASKLVSDVIARYSETEQKQLKIEAEKHAYRLSLNTSEPYHSVGACRDYCGKLADIEAQRND
jgi:hypothetical protein